MEQLILIYITNIGSSKFSSLPIRIRNSIEEKGST
jgi:hypothetical protein